MHTFIQWYVTVGCSLSILFSLIMIFVGPLILNYTKSIAKDPTAKKFEPDHAKLKGSTMIIGLILMAVGFIIVGVGFVSLAFSFSLLFIHATLWYAIALLALTASAYAVATISGVFSSINEGLRYIFIFASIITLVLAIFAIWK